MPFKLRIPLECTSAVILVLSASAIVSLAAASGCSERPRKQAAKQEMSVGEPLSAAAAVVPDDADIVLILDNARALRPTRVGEAASRFLGDSGQLAQTAKAWPGLAAALGWTEAEAFDRLAGKRLILVARSHPSGKSHWALTSEVSEETATRLKERLKVAPRAIDNGHPILSVENGAFELTSHRARAAVPGGVVRHTIVLGPTGASGVFDQLVTSLAGAGESTLAKTSVVKAIDALGKPELVILSRPGARDATRAAERGWERFVLLAAQRAVADDGAVRGDAWVTWVVVHDPARREELKLTPMSSDAAFGALAQGSVFTLFQVRSAADILGFELPLSNPLETIPISGAVRERLAGRQAVSVTAAEPGEDWRLGFVMAMETPDTPALAATADGEIAQAVYSFEQPGNPQAAPPRDFGGLAPQAVRVLRLELAESSPIRSMVKSDVTVGWCYPSLEAAGWRSEAAGSTRQRGQDRALVRSLNELAKAPPTEAEPGPEGEDSTKVPGWGVLAVVASDSDEGPTPAQVVRAAGEALLRPAVAGTESRWLWLMSSRPAAMERLLPAFVPDWNGLRSMMRRLEAASCKLAVNEEGDVQGEITFELAPTPVESPAGAFEERAKSDG